MRVTGGPALCVCGWTGTLLERSPCPACARPPSSRLDAERIAALRAVAADPAAPLNRSRAIRLIEIGALAPVGRRPAPNEGGRHARPPRRQHALTELGRAGLAAADRLDAARTEQASADRLALQHRPGEDPLAPRPLGPEQVADLVDRAREGTEPYRVDSGRRTTSRRRPTSDS